MRSLLKIGFALLLIAVLLIGVSYSMLRAQGISGPSSPGSRLVASDKRPFSGAIAVDASGPINLTLRQGPVPALEVRGEQRLLANIDTSVDGDTLHIGPRGILLRHRQPIEVTVTMPSLERLSVNGSGEQVVSGFAGERIELMLGGSGQVRFNGRYREIQATIHGSGAMEVTGGNSDKVQAEILGSGQLTLVGAARELDATTRGSGELDARHLRADEARLEHQGSGSSALYARRTAHVELAGSGAVTVYGNPDERSVTRHGSGGVTFQD
ncbi:head GIN domain-containing protein [uncultured Massilia sp.]|uniref:head GIN domain-containing protein n=1 Tax=uncultured Massilia sp. TaxID=169973 RepID=UPI0025F95634|nr:head GIN domain-containing protein [uncultured Massilia sp.]